MKEKPLLLGLLSILPLTIMSPDSFVRSSAFADAQAKFLPKGQLTPGAVVDVGIKELCSPGYAKKMRAVSKSTRRAVLVSYGISQQGIPGYELDHLISLELGGSNDIQNLWPEPSAGTWNANVKDSLENELHRRVCHQAVSLRAAQKMISENWIAAYKAIFKRQAPAAKKARASKGR